MLPVQKIKRALTIPFLAIAISLFWKAQPTIAFSGGPPNGLTGAPGEMTCAVSGCHGSFDVNSGNGSLTISGLPQRYGLNQEIEIALTLAQGNRSLYGFQVTALDDNGRKIGELIVSDAQRTQKEVENIIGSLREYVSHTLAGTAPTGTDQGRWTFKWKAPAQNQGRVTFYAVGNAANGNGNAGGDFIYTTSASIAAPAPLTTIATVNAASFIATGMLAPDSIAAAFSANLSPSTVAAAGNPLPIELGGTQFLVRDALGVERFAQLFFVSPTQINYIVPQGAAAGLATMTARRDGIEIAQGRISIAPVVPGLFAANADGRGVAAAVLFRRKSNRQESFEPVARLNPATNQFEAIDLDLGPESDETFLLLFGTGVRNRSALTAATVSIGGVSVAPLYAGPQGTLFGLDQINLPLPRQLAGRGAVDLLLTVDGKQSNSLSLRIK